MMATKATRCLESHQKVVALAEMKMTLVKVHRLSLHRCRTHPPASLQTASYTTPVTS